MKIQVFSTILFFSLASGIIWWGYQSEWIIVRIPQKTIAAPTAPPTQIKKKIYAHFWHINRWKQEEFELIWSDDISTTLTHIIHRWLLLIEEEGIITRHISIQSIACNGIGHTAYVSLDRNPFNKESSMQEKWLLMEGLLKTIRESGCLISSIQLLVHHQPMHDYHLDFSFPWPLQGFYTKR